MHYVWGEQLRVKNYNMYLNQSCSKTRVVNSSFYWFISGKTKSSGDLNHQPPWWQQGKQPFADQLAICGKAARSYGIILIGGTNPEEFPTTTFTQSGIGVTNPFCDGTRVRRVAETNAYPALNALRSNNQTSCVVAPRIYQIESKNCIQNQLYYYKGPETRTKIKRFYFSFTIKSELPPTILFSKNE